MLSKISNKKDGGKPGGKASVPSIISQDMNILGNIVSEGSIDIDGKIEGNIRCDRATIRENGRVNGDIVANHIAVHGEVHGLIKAKSVNLYSTCHVEGIIMHESISIEDGAFVDGKFKRTDKVFVDENEEPEEVRMLENIRLISTNTPSNP
jgi:cytoskeletal protein CcmA (bactofilin family)